MLQRSACALARRALGGRTPLVAAADPAAQAPCRQTASARVDAASWLRAPERAFASLAFDVLHASDVRAEGSELRFHALVPAVEVVDAPHEGFAFGDEAGDDERCARA